MKPQKAVIPAIATASMETIASWVLNSTHRWVAILLLSGLLLRGAIAAILPAGFDEAYYFLYTQNPSWSYFDHPPLVAIATGFGPWLTGSVSPFTIRLGPILLYTGALFLLYRTGLKLFGQQAAVLTLAIATAIPIFQVGFGVLTLPDNPLMVCWAACLYCAAGEFFDRTPYQPSHRLALISLWVGLACLGKYHGLALGFGLICFCLFSPSHRSALSSPWTALGCVLFLLAISPVLLWNAQHDWISLTYQSSRAVPAENYQLLHLLTTWLLGIAFLFPSLSFPLWWAIAASSLHQVARCFTRKPIEDLQAKHWLILCLSLPIVAAFTYMGGYRDILPTWPMPGFWGTSLLLGYWAAQWQRPSPRGVWRWLVGSGLTASIILLIAALHVEAGVLQKPSTNAWLGGFIPVATDASTQLVDIRQLRQGFVDSPEFSQALQAADFIFTNQLFLGGQVAIALAPLTTAPVTCFSNDPRGFAFWHDPEEWLGQNGLYVTTRQFQMEGGGASSARQLPYHEYFASIEPMGTIPILRGGEVVEEFLVYRANQLLKPYPWPYGLQSVR